MNQHSHLYVRSLGKRELKLLQSVNANKIFYEFDDMDLKSRVNCQQKTISDEPESFFHWNNEVIDKITVFIDEISDSINNSKYNSYPFKEYLKSFLRKKLSADIRLILLAKNDNKAIMQMEYPITIKKLYKNKKVIGREWHSYFHVAKHCLFLILKLIKWPFKFYKIKKKSDHLIVPYYENVRSNAEFFSIFNSVSKPTVIVKNNSELHNYINILKKKFVIKSNLFITPSQFLHLLLVGFDLSFNFLRKHYSPLLLDAIFSYIKEYSIILSYFNSVDVKYVGVIRGDMYSASSLLKETCSSLGIATYSYSHAVYFYREYYLSSVNYHWYGVSGQNEKNLYSGLWNNKMNYVPIGQVTSGFRELDYVNNLRNKKLINEKVVCVYPTTVMEQIIPNNETDYNEFIDAVCASCKSDYGFVFYKSKINLKIARNDIVENNQKTIENLAIKKMKNSLLDKFKLFDYDTTVYDTYDKIDIGYVYSMSTVAFELIQNKKKVLVYWPFKSNPHPFSKFTPLLVAASKNDFVIKAKKIKNMGINRYEKYILPTLKYCLVPSTPNASIDKFINLIESNHIN